ncbi:MAG: hypothetical protein A2087_11355 [Spirochaetes bacterium GWD1_61_31]|nr:MAG: hypothetical protein A2Y37_01355 [Spirochaetes bacterium GWB1_60_80]OHD28552.1 MAG: hypothetical protein A2004_07085 [Spirochaetes bacterium GWC1_61_12]OHD35713.1 MAG: hypothetical protein A2087_11355 [Spirochaetes bacterium GWD1_61_31]OHD41849.1 MAG: hypothetical protein A2Y35_04450 [Spirochaetes bacterium GWE1_60_18]OHD57830.1 MAG: hypothetical protein A2Y32_14145 [Spirochaetes bacterium GWF1_60_12]HAP42572.1 hypothetical protein [Spirochaetaceae bacterium]
MDSFLECAKRYHDRPAGANADAGAGAEDNQATRLAGKLPSAPDCVVHPDLQNFLAELNKSNSPLPPASPPRQAAAAGLPDQERHSRELSQAYETLQRRNDEFRHELAMARKVQTTFIPGAADFPQRPELDFAGYYEAMADVGGDLYDVIRIGKNAYGLIMADVSGHGVAAALVTALVKIAFRSRMHWGVATDQVCRAVNEELYDILGEGERYVTAFVAIVNLEDGSIEYTNAGHHPGLLLRDGAVRQLDSKGNFLGIFEAPEYTAQREPLQAGDRIILFTDGIIEARSYLDEEYGHHRLEEALRDHAGDQPTELVKAVTRDLDGFTMGAPAHDDRALLCTLFNGRCPAPEAI